MKLRIKYCCDELQESMDAGDITLDGDAVVFLKEVPITYCPFCGAEIDSMVENCDYDDPMDGDE